MKRSLLLCLIMAATALSACSSVKNELGVGRRSPDEFTVVKRAPLSLPPDYALRPPVDGTLSSATDTTDQARSSVFGASGNTTSEITEASGNSDRSFLSKVGADQADTDIRSVINRENGYIALENQHLGDKLIFWKDQDKEAAKALESPVDAKAEAQRLKKNKEEGKPINEGDVPVIKKKEGAIDKLF